MRWRPGRGRFRCAYTIISYSSSVSLCLAIISPISNTLLQTPTVTNYVDSQSDCCFYNSEDRHLVLRYDGCLGLLRGKSRLKGRVDVSEIWLWAASSVSGTMLSSMDVSVLCI